MRLTDDGTKAEVVIDVTSRQARDDWRFVKANIKVGERVFALEGTNDDGDWSDAATDAAKRFASWIRDNREHIRGN